MHIYIYIHTYIYIYTYIALHTVSSLAILEYHVMTLVVGQHGPET